MHHDLRECNKVCCFLLLLLVRVSTDEKMKSLKDCLGNTAVFRTTIPSECKLRVFKSGELNGWLIMLLTYT